METASVVVMDATLLLSPDVTHTDSSLMEPKQAPLLLTSGKPSATVQHLARTTSRHLSLVFISGNEDDDSGVEHPGTFT